jgi:hypothetical protein
MFGCSFAAEAEGLFTKKKLCRFPYTAKETVRPLMVMPYIGLQEWELMT